MCIEVNIELPIKEGCLQKGQRGRFVDWPTTTNDLPEMSSSHNNSKKDT